jgi:hypothetical protein
VASTTVPVAADLHLGAVEGGEELVEVGRDQVDDALVERRPRRHRPALDDGGDGELHVTTPFLGQGLGEGGRVLDDLVADLATLHVHRGGRADRRRGRHHREVSGVGDEGPGGTRVRAGRGHVHDDGQRGIEEGLRDAARGVEAATRGVEQHDQGLVSLTGSFGGGVGEVFDRDRRDGAVDDRRRHAAGRVLVRLADGAAGGHREEAGEQAGEGDGRSETRPARSPRRLALEPLHSTPGSMRRAYRGCT